MEGKIMFERPGPSRALCSFNILPVTDILVNTEMPTVKPVYKV